VYVNLAWSRKYDNNNYLDVRALESGFS